MNATQAVAHMEVAGFPFLADSLAFIVLVYVLETVLDVRQFLRYRQHTVPAQLHGVVDEDTFRKSQVATRTEAEERPSERGSEERSALFLSLFSSFDCSQ